jgi:hypothetical protein
MERGRSVYRSVSPLGALRRRLNIEMPSHYHHHPDEIAVFPSIFVEQA